MKNPKYLYAVRDTTTGELVGNLTNPKRSFWKVKGFAKQAIVHSPKRNQLELVTFELTEVEKETV